MECSNLSRVLLYAQRNNLSSVYLALADSYDLLCNSTSITETIFSQEVSSELPIPRSIQQALSPPYIQEWGVAIDKDNHGFILNDCFEIVKLPKGARIFPGVWVFSRKRDDTPKARFCVGGHRQILGAEIGRAHV